MIISVQKLQEKIIKLLTSYNVAEYDAQIAASVLIEGDLRGYHEHGVNRIIQLCEGLKQKTINPEANTTMLVDLPAVGVIDGNYGLGYSVGKYAMERAIDKAKTVGVGVVGVINSSHLGILAYYSQIASNNGCIGLVMSTTSPAVVVKGGCIKTFGTNPISYSIPHKPYDVTADFATSKVSRGFIYRHLNNGSQLPAGCAVDAHGISTHNPQQALEGGLTTIDGDIKGSLISFLVSIMAGNLIGGVSNHCVKGTRYMDQKPNKGDIFMAFNIDAFTDQTIFDNGLNQFLAFINSQNADFKTPGQQDYQLREKSLRTGIVIPDELAHFLQVE